MINLRHIDFRLLVMVTVIFFSCADNNHPSEENPAMDDILEVNVKEIPPGRSLYALVGAMLIDGTGAPPLENSCVLVKGQQIVFAGKNGGIDIPDSAEVIDLTGLTLLPGLIDAHYHDEDSDTLTTLYLRNGVTSVRDPGEWIESYDTLRASGKVLPRLFLAGPHLDFFPPAYPEDSYIVKDKEEAQLAVAHLRAQGATVIKVYYGLSIGMIREVCRTAKKVGIPVTAHLEITDARDAINAGLDGIEHITSFGTCLLPMRQVEKYKQDVMADKNARRKGRYEVWSSFNFDDSPEADSLIAFLKRKKTFISPTLAVFERRADKGDSVEVKGFENMLRFVGRAEAGGAVIVVGSHSYVPYAELGYAFHREMELLQEAGLAPMEVIVAATLQNARFFRSDRRLGSIEKDKLADLVVIEGNPLLDIKAMRNVKRVMLNGVWIERDITHF